MPSSHKAAHSARPRRVHRAPAAPTHRAERVSGGPLVPRAVIGALSGLHRQVLADIVSRRFGASVPQVFPGLSWRTTGVMT